MRRGINRPDGCLSENRAAAREDVRRQFIGEHTGAAPRIAVVQIQAEIAEREKSWRIGKKMLSDHVNQGLMIGEPVQEHVDRLLQPRDLAHLFLILPQPGEQCFQMTSM